LTDQRKRKGLIIIVMVVIALIMLGISNLPLPSGLNVGGYFGSNPTPTYYPGPTYPVPTYPDFTTPAPTIDPASSFHIDQRNNVEYVWNTNPTAYRPVIVDPNYSLFSHVISVYGTYTNWRYDVFMKTEFGSTWEYQASGTTDAEGDGYATIPLNYAEGGHTYQIVALLDPHGGGIDPDLPSEMSELAVINAVTAGTLRASNLLTLEVVVSSGLL
jgi:hypothetical protein